MKLNSFTKRISIAGRWIAAALLFVCATAFAWQGAFLADSAAMAAPQGTLIAADLGNEAKSGTDDAKRANKNFVRDTKNTVQDAAQSNSEKVKDAFGDDSAVGRKAGRDAQRIVNRANEDASRTQKAIDKNLGGVKGAINRVKDALD
ncbi:hypothetical protein [Leptolyngbya ohadii]|uniref:hypothetical protein n=1 Tax=Leptolyngbya ohadii TaxID=1962290 RepID=UPI000B59C69A|nr:hypothetical protein [Leptolyngbya ohadii]